MRAGLIGQQQRPRLGNSTEPNKFAIRLSLLFVASFLFLFFWLFTFPVLRFALTFVIYFAVDLPTDTHTHTRVHKHARCLQFFLLPFLLLLSWPTGHYSLRLAEAYLEGPARPRHVLHVCVCGSLV